MNSYNVLITEDHTLIRFGLKTALESKSFIGKIFEAPDAQKALEIIQSEHIDAVIMDLGLPGINGIEATENIKKKSPQTKIVILTSHNTKEEVLKSIKAGASAYCSKEIDPENLALIIQSVLNGAAWFDPSVSNYILDAIKTGKEDSQTIPTGDFNLTKRELEVLAFIKIAKKLKLSINTVKAHVSNIMQKLEVDDRTQAAIKAISNNII